MRFIKLSYLSALVLIGLLAVFSYASLRQLTVQIEDQQDVIDLARQAEFLVLERREILILVLMLTVLALEGGLIFRPMERRIRRDDSILRDEISRRQRAEEASARLAAIVESSNDAIIGKTLEGTITSWNRAAQDMYGYTADEAIGKPISMLVPPDQPDDVPEILQKLEQGERIQFYEIERARKDGKVITVSLTISPICNADGAIIGISTIARDITERKQARAREMKLALEKEQARLMAEFIQDTAHEFRTPLAVLQSGLYMIRRMPDEDKRNQKLDVLEEQVRRLTQGIEQIHNLISLDRASPQVLMPVNLNRVIEAVRSLAQERAAMKGLSLSANLTADLPPILGNENQLQSAIIHLIENAVRYTPGGGTITLRTYSENYNLVVEISDTGSGISAEDLPHIFERFYKADKARTRNDSGLGLGLAMVKKIVEAHQGRIEVDSVPAWGSTFRIWLPIDEPPT